MRNRSLKTFALKQALVQYFIIWQHWEYKEILMNEGQGHNVRCSRVVVLLATSVLGRNIQRKHSVCQSIIHQYDFFFSLSIYSVLRLSTQADCSMPLNPSPNNWGQVILLSENSLLILDLTRNRSPISVCLLRWGGIKEKITKQQERVWDVLLYSPFDPHTQTLISPQSQRVSL